MTGPVLAAALSVLAEEYLAFRRRLGFEMDKPGFLVRRFAGYCDGAGITRVTDQAVLDWVLLAQPVAPSYRWLRLNAARGFAIYLHALSTKNEPSTAPQSPNSNWAATGPATPFSTSSTASLPRDANNR